MTRNTNNILNCASQREFPLSVVKSLPFQQFLCLVQKSRRKLLFMFPSTWLRGRYGVRQCLELTCSIKCRNFNEESFVPWWFAGQHVPPSPYPRVSSSATEFVRTPLLDDRPSWWSSKHRASLLSTCLMTECSVSWKRFFDPARHQHFLGKVQIPWGFLDYHLSNATPSACDYLKWTFVWDSHPDM